MTTTPETLSTRLRAAADDIAFQGRPDPHDDKALLREAAAVLDSPDLRLLKDANAEWQELGQWLVTTFQPGAVEPAAVLCPDGEYESGAQFCRRALQMALERGAFAAAMSPVREDTSPDVDQSPTGQARRALQRLGPTVAGVGGSIKLAAAVGIGPACGLSIDEFRPLLAAWNAASTPRWADEAIEVQLRDRYEQHKADFFADIPTTGPTSSEPEQDPAARLLPRPA